MKRAIIALALALPACGDCTEARLDRCKTEMKAEHQKTIAMIREKADKYPKAPVKQGIPPGRPPSSPEESLEIIKGWQDDMRSDMVAAAADLEQASEVLLKKWQGAAGLAECEKTLAVTRRWRAMRP